MKKLVESILGIIQMVREHYPENCNAQVRDNPECELQYAKWYIGIRRIAMRSGYEVAYAHWLDSKGIIWQYEPQTFWLGPSIRYLGKTYTPDFWLPAFNTFVEIKGQYTTKDKAKVATFKALYPRYVHVVLKGKEFRELVGKLFMEMGGTAPKVLFPGSLATLNTRISYR
jgi:hypothetical protein